MTVAGGLPRPVPRSVARAETTVRLRVAEDVELTALANLHGAPGERPTVLVVHGLTGHARVGYSYGTAEKALAAGFDAVRLNLRGCGESEEASPEIYHAGVSGDLREVLLRLREEGHDRVFVVGFSLGGNVALKLAGELGEEARGLTAGIVAISPPIDLAACCDTLNEGPMNRFYQAVFLRDLRRRLKRKHRRHPERLPIDGLEEVRTLREFDDRFTAPLGGFGDADTYYARASAGPLLGRIRVPTLLIHARDDTFVPFSDFEVPAIAANPFLELLAPEHGGHTGFIARRRTSAGSRRDRGRFWAENRAIQFCGELASGETA
jgi:predicted alpha/beta-fold hydrolase